MLDTTTAEKVTLELAELSVAVSAGELVVQADVVTEGREAWGRIKTASKMMREDWRKVGEALLVGRKAHRSDKLFGQWVRENGFDDIQQKVRADAMWLTENWEATQKAFPGNDMCHPTHIRQAYREVQATPSNPALTPPMAAIPAPVEGLPPTAQVEADKDALPFDLDEVPAPSCAQAVDAKADDGPSVSIFSGDQSDLQRVRSAAGELLPIRAERSGELFYTDFMKQSHPDYFVGRAVKKLYTELRAHTDPKTAVQHAAEEIRQAEKEMLDNITQRLMEIGNQAMSSFLKQIDGNPYLGSDDPKVAKLLTRALDEGSSATERMGAIEALKRVVG